jgi:hypothetical protein
VEKKPPPPSSWWEGEEAEEREAMPIELPRGLPFAVDTWTPASALKRHRFLTHAHRDHLAGITTTSAAGAIYASRLTVLIARHIFPQVTHHQQPTPRLSLPYPFLSI